MLDKFNRKINYLRISVTDRCNLRCVYCMPEEGIQLMNHNEILRYEEIETVVKEAAALGINKVRLTGGEPLTRKNIESLIEKISNINEIEHLSLTTNGTLLADKAESLKKAGLTSINISLDTLDKERYEKITRGGNIKDVVDGIESAIDNKFLIKLNMVVLKDLNIDEIENMQKFCNDRNIKLQLINHFNLNAQKQDNYKFDRPPKCSACNRIRLLSNGVLKPCLHSDMEYKINFENISDSLKQTILAKPEKGLVCSSKQMIEIGG